MSQVKWQSTLCHLKLTCLYVAAHVVAVVVAVVVVVVVVIVVNYVVMCVFVYVCVCVSCFLHWALLLTFQFDCLCVLGAKIDRIQLKLDFVYFLFYFYFCLWLSLTGCAIKQLFLKVDYWWEKEKKRKNAKFSLLHGWSTEFNARIELQSKRERERERERKKFKQFEQLKFHSEWVFHYSEVGGLERQVVYDLSEWKRERHLCISFGAFVKCFTLDWVWYMFGVGLASVAFEFELLTTGFQCSRGEHQCPYWDIQLHRQIRSLWVRICDRNIVYSKFLPDVQCSW